MSKKVLVIAGSPRKDGNSDILCQQFARGAKEAGHAVEIVYVRYLNIKPCLACYACRAAKECVLKDDMKGLLEKMVAADVIVLSTPVYFFTMDGQMKVMIDRTMPRYRELKGKEFYFIATAAAGKADMKRTMDGFYGFTDNVPQAKVCGEIYGELSYEVGDVKKTPAFEQAYQMGKEV